MKKQSRGFTLIELLVVIAIIGILSSVVLASLSTARNKGADAAAMSEINNIRAQAAIYYDTTQSYGTPFAKAGCPLATNTATAGLFYDPSIVALLVGANAQTGGNTTSTSNTVVCVADTTSFAVATVLKGSNVTYCVDSNGGAKKGSSTVTSGTAAAGAITVISSNSPYNCI